jgi:hypothetical protein
MNTRCFDADIGANGYEVKPGPSALLLAATNDW